MLFLTPAHVAVRGTCPVRNLTAEHEPTAILYCIAVVGVTGQCDYYNIEFVTPVVRTANVLEAGERPTDGVGKKTTKSLTGSRDLARGVLINDFVLSRRRGCRSRSER